MTPKHIQLANKIGFATAVLLVVLWLFIAINLYTTKGLSGEMNVEVVSQTEITVPQAGYIPIVAESYITESNIKFKEGNGLANIFETEKKLNSLLKKWPENRLVSPAMPELGAYNTNELTIIAFTCEQLKGKKMIFANYAFQESEDSIVICLDVEDIPSKYEYEQPLTQDSQAICLVYMENTQLEDIKSIRFAL